MEAEKDADSHEVPPRFRTLRFSPGRDLMPAIAVVVGVIVGVRGWTSVQQHGPTQLWVGFGLAALGAVVFCINRWQKRRGH
jgi:hypothetical protein